MAENFSNEGRSRKSLKNGEKGDEMDIQSIKKQYELVVGLGCNCQVAYQLKRLGLRKFSTPVDNMRLDDLRSLNKVIVGRSNGKTCRLCGWSGTRQ